MKIKKNQLFKIAYLFIFLACIILENSSISILACLVTILGLMGYGIDFELAVLVSTIMPSEIASFINIFICLVMILKKNGLRLLYRSKILIPTIFLLGCSLVNAFLTGALFNLLFGFGYYCILFIIVKGLHKKLSEGRLVSAIKDLLFVEYLCGIVIIFVNKSISPGDVHMGTFTSAHFYTFWLICSLVYLYIYYKHKCSFFSVVQKNFIWFGMGIVFIYLSDAKNILIGALLAILIYGLTFIFTKKYNIRIILSIILLYIGLFGGLLFLNVNSVKQFIYDKFPVAGMYIYDLDYAYKYQYFEGTVFEELSFPRGLFGYGIGQYGSRAANLFAYDYMYRENSTINKLIANNFRSYVCDNYKKYVQKYDQNLVSIIHWRSAVMSYPFSSLIAFLAENGWIGLICVSCIFGEFGRKSKYGFLVVFLFCACIFDLYFDHISIVLTILVFVRKSRVKTVTINRSISEK